MANKIRLGVFGLGTVGSGLINIIQKRHDRLMSQYGIELEVAKAVVRTPSKKRGCDVSGIQISRDFHDILDDPSIDIVVELIGGTQEAAQIVSSALRADKPVVSANKALIAAQGPELYRLSSEHKTPLYAEASVGGGIPILKTLRESLVANRITSLTAIINGTTNFILTKMEEEGLSYHESLKLAGEMGFAEADPTMDVEGFDAMQKLRILGAHMLGGAFPEGDILCEGISGLVESDFRFARSQGLVIKLLAIARRRSDGMELRVHPTLIPRLHPLASVRNEFNAVYLNGDAVGEVMLSGRGAGSLPTASAVYADIVDICRRTTKAVRLEDGSQPLRVIDADEIETEYYLRWTVLDKPGVIGEVAGVLGRHGISVSTVSAELVPNVPDLGELEIVVHRTQEKHIRCAMSVIDRLDSIRGKGTFIRIERSLA